MERKWKEATFEQYGICRPAVYFAVKQMMRVSYRIQRALICLLPSPAVDERWYSYLEAIWPCKDPSSLSYTTVPCESFMFSLNHLNNKIMSKKLLKTYRSYPIFFATSNTLLK
jgi:hypothetical protein